RDRRSPAVCGKSQPRAKAIREAVCSDRDAFHPGSFARPPHNRMPNGHGALEYGPRVHRLLQKGTAKGRSAQGRPVHTIRVAGLAGPAAGPGDYARPITMALFFEPKPRQLQSAASTLAARPWFGR